MQKQAKYLIYFQMIYLMLAGLLIDLGLPRSIRYIMDITNLLLLVLTVLSPQKTRLRKGAYTIAAMGIWLGYMLISGLFHHPSIFLTAWAMRNWARGFVLFCACLAFLEPEDVKRLMKIFAGLYVFNAALSLGQYLVLGTRGTHGDYIGGIFGSKYVGANGYSNLFYCAALIHALCRNFVEKRTTKWSLFIMLSAMILSAVQEIKVFFYEYILIVGAVCVLFSILGEMEKKTLLETVAAAVIAFSVGLLVLYLTYPKHFSFVVGQRSIWDYEEDTRATYKISRFKFIPEINEKAFGESVSLQLFGFGFGNCEYSSFGLFTSKLFDKIGDLNYHFFSHQTLYLEGGLIGLALFLMIFFIPGLQNGLTVLRRKEAGAVQIFLCVFCMILFVNVAYNNAARTELSYFMYFSLAAGYILPGRETEAQSILGGWR